MASYTWKESFSVNHEELDQQHKVFLETLKNLHKLIGSPESPENLQKAVVALGHFIDLHFVEEEEHLVAIGYPQLVRQRKQHDFFRGRLTELENSCQQLSTVELGKSLVFIRDRLVKHILEADWDFPRFVTEEKLLYSA